MSFLLRECTSLEYAFPLPLSYLGYETATAVFRASFAMALIWLEYVAYAFSCVVPKEISFASRTVDNSGTLVVRFTRSPLAFKYDSLASL